ncbi:MAG: glycosyltransferase [Thermoplasmatales archaeon]
MAKVSIVLINYNYAQYLDERIQSFLNQTYKDFELIILDNGSTDNSIEVINKYTQDPRVFVRYYPENVLIFKRWNGGLELTTGEYLLFASSDDSCDPHLLERLVEKLDNYPSVGVAYSQSLAIDENSNRFDLPKDLVNGLYPDLWANDFIFPGHEMCKYLLFGNVIPFKALIRRSIFVEAGMYNTQIPYEADWLLWAKASMISDVAYISEALTFGRMHRSSFGRSVRQTARLEGRLVVMHYLLSKVKPPEQFWEAVYKPMVKYWIRLLFSEKTPIQTNLRIYNLLREIDPGINLRLIESVFETLKHKSGILPSS